MKHGVKPTVKQCRLMESEGLDPMEWLVIKNTATELVLTHKEDNHIKVIPRG